MISPPESATSTESLGERWPSLRPLDSAVGCRYITGLMRTILVISFFLLACADDTTRLDGPGCQPACMTNDTEGDSAAERIAVCLDEDLMPDRCVAESANPVCSSGIVSCGGDAPTCPGAVNERPTCAR